MISPKLGSEVLGKGEVAFLGAPRMADDDARRHQRRVQSIAACTRFATRSSRVVCHGSGDMKLVM